MADIKELLFAFSEEIRLRIVLLLQNSYLCVNCIVDAINLPQPTISRHLALLRRTGVVNMTKDKLHCYYALNQGDPFGQLKGKLVKTFSDSLRNMKPFKGDVKRLAKTKESCNADCKVGMK